MAHWQPWRLQALIYLSAEQIERKRRQTPALHTDFPLPVIPLTWGDLLWAGEKVAESPAPFKFGFYMEATIYSSKYCSLGRDIGLWEIGLNLFNLRLLFSLLFQYWTLMSRNSMFIHVQSLCVYSLKLVLCQIQNKRQGRFVQVHVSSASLLHLSSANNPQDILC